MTRHILFCHYWWVAIFGTVAGILLILFLHPEEAAALIISLVGTALAFCYFVQQQLLSETTLFKQLFSEFNQRYNELNGRLVVITQQESPTPDHRKIIVDYFNLCAEEYLFFKDGYIRRDVWRSWCRGMLWYLDHGTIRSIWEEEMATSSYYGLSIKIIEAGSK